MASATNNPNGDIPAPELTGLFMPSAAAIAAPAQSFPRSAGSI